MALDYFDLAQALLNCACLELAQQETPWEGDCCVVPGQISYDSCCENGGQAWARVVRVFPTTNFPNPDETADLSNCSGISWAVIVEVGVIRCVCFDMCDCTVKQDNAKKVLGDAQALLTGVLCCFERGSCSQLDFRVVDQEVVGPEGGCGGSKVTVAVRHEICCPDRPED